ncbi:F-box protein At3g07870-like [Papaver somniferum]|uniref:F-box protein At3g07870-like n=1 Tax=Papaver somniferum TaxID=3469 RepID=UPI000E704E47|nr:F-box protein At3g07870-like [Papaver somniferum]
MNDLPSDILPNIFFRLHADLVLVCKPWRNAIRNLIKDPSFIKNHLAHSKLLLQKLDENYSQDASANACEIVRSGFLKLQYIDSSKSDKCRLKYIEYCVDANKKSYEMKNKTINTLSIRPAKYDLHLVMIASCNGLICSTVRHSNLDDPVHIFNPVTKEYVFLPRCTGTNGIIPYEMVYGFGYSSSTDEYKVVRIYQKPAAWFFQVYILGNESSTWKEEKETPLFNHGFRYSKSVSVNGELFWLDYSLNILAFSLADEEFRYIASPLIVGGNNTYGKRLCVFGDCLCLVDLKSATGKRNTHADIWLFKNNNDMNVQQNGTWIWNRELTVQAETRYDFDLLPLAFTKNGKLLFWQDHRFVSCYDPKTAVLEELRKDEDGHRAMSFYQATPHTNSFVSLKALGMKCRRRPNYKGK